MLEVIDMAVRSLDVTYNEVSWGIKDTSEDVFDYEFRVLRSESAAGPYEPMSVVFQDRYLFRDSQMPGSHAFRLLNYILRVTNKLTGESVDYGPVTKEPDEDLISLEIRRHLSTLYREFTGRRCWLLPVRTFGQRCPACWDHVLSKRKRSGCKICFDTGFARGYHHPIEVWAQIESGTPAAQQHTNVGTLQQVNNSARISADITAKPRDLLIEAENHRWRVTSVGDTQHNRVSVLLELQLHRIPASDVEYSIPLRLGTSLHELELTPARQFTNPQNRSSLEDTSTQILRIYNAGGVVP